MLEGKVWWVSLKYGVYITDKKSFGL
jgi:hypothetical protein